MLFCKFCKRECKNENSLRNHERLCKLNPNRQTVNIEEARKKANQKHSCQYCDKLVSFTNLKKHEIKCKNNPKVIEEKGKTCPVCDKIFVSESITCSYSCSNVHFRHLRNKPDNYVRYRTICFNFHKKECVVCGENKIVSVHHINENHDDNRPENLIPLCPTHHQYVHSRFKNDVLPIIESYLKQTNISG
jgi:hypothetical protein